MLLLYQSIRHNLCELIRRQRKNELRMSLDPIELIFSALLLREINIHIIVIGCKFLNLEDNA